VNSEVQTARVEPGASDTKYFIDVSQAFGKVWHTGLLFELKCFPTPIVYTTEIIPHWRDMSSKIPRRIH